MSEASVDMDVFVDMDGSSGPGFAPLQAMKWNSLFNNGLDIGILRPWLDLGGKSWWTDKDGHNHPSELPAILTPEEWLLYDKTVMGVAQAEAPILTHIAGGGTVLVPDALQKLFFTGESAIKHLSMRTIPLPITHASTLQLPSKKPLGVRVAAKRVWGQLEKMVVGPANFSFGPEGSDSKILGLLDVAKGLGPVEALDYLTTSGLIPPYTYAFNPGSGKLPPVNVSASTFLKSPLIPPNKVLIFKVDPLSARVIDGLRPTLVQWGDSWRVIAVFVPYLFPDSIATLAE
jgi:hypothetical protein